MKQKDITLILVVAFVSAVIGIFISNAVISGPKKRNEKVETVETVTADFPEPDKKYFNEKSIDPTQLIRIGENSNPAPFNAN